METLEAIAQRKSCRCYEPTRVEDEKLQAILKAANSAPLAGEISLVLITCPNMLGPMNDASKYTMQNSGNEFLMGRAALPGYEPYYGAPAMVLICAPEGPYAQANCAAAAATACIAATDLGLGSTFAATPAMAFLPEYDMLQWLEIPEGHKPYFGVMLGYKAGEAFGTPSPDRTMDNVSYILASEGCC